MKIETRSLNKMVFIIPTISIDYEYKFISLVWLKWGIFIGRKEWRNNDESN